MRLSTKLLLISELVLLLLVFGMVVPIRVQMRNQVLADMQHELSAIVATGALQLNGDLHEQFLADPTPDSPAFQTLRNGIARVADANGFSPDNIYTLYPDDTTGGLRFGVMLQQDTFIGDPYERKDHHKMVLGSGETYASDIFTDDYGDWIAAVAPIRNSNGNIVAMLELAKTVGEVFARVDRYILITTASAIAGLVLASIGGYLVLRWIVIRPVAAIHAGMTALANHDFTHRTKLRTGDEFEQLADALNNLSNQLNVARKIQEGFVPQRPPSAEGYRFAYRSDPCDATGGDYIDAFDLPNGDVAILVADVTGHGIGPSLIMASCRSALRALAQTGLPPGPLLEKLEQQLADDLQSGRFITMIFGVLSPDGRLTYANAGHAPAMVCHAGGDNPNTLQLDSHRPPLGIFLEPVDGDTCALDDMQTTVQLQPGDRVVFTSDGVNESQDPSDQQFGLERIEATAQRSDLDPDAFVELLNDQVTLHRAGQPPVDDVTVLCVDRV
ncbi:MAG: SpoIIE family protein phosphatase [Planctomycetota bacterium]